MAQKDQLPENIKRINYLAKKKKEVGLTQAELEEQAALRKEYLENFRKNFTAQMDSISIQTPDGIITPLKFKKKKDDK